MTAIKTAFLSLLLIHFGLFNLAHASNEDDLPLITVSASAKSKVMPDQAQMSVSFVKSDMVAKKARKSVDNSVNAFLQDLEDFDLAQKSLDSSQTQLYPKYDYRNSQKVFLGYEVKRHVSFKLNTLSQLEELVKIVTENKASELGNIHFTVKHPEKTKHQALRKAINKAKKNAELIAEGFGVRLGNIHKVSHSDSTASPPQHRVMALSHEMSDGSGASYQQKEIEFNEVITVSFTID